MIELAIIDDNPIDIRLIKAFADASPVDYIIHSFASLQDALDHLVRAAQQVLLLNHLMGPHFDCWDSAMNLRDAGYQGNIFAMSSDMQLMNMTKNEEGLVSAFVDKRNLRPVLNSGFGSHTT